MSQTTPTWRTPLLILIVGCILTLAMGVRQMAGLFCNR